MAVKTPADLEQRIQKARELGVPDAVIQKRVQQKFGATATPKKKGVVRSLLEGAATSEAVPIAGGILGGLTGGIIGAPSGPGALATGAAGAGIGAAGGVAMQEMLQDLLGIQQQTGTEQLKRAGTEAALSAGGELVGGGISRIAAKPLSRIAPSIANRVLRPATTQLAEQGVEQELKTGSKQLGERALEAGIPSRIKSVAQKSLSEIERLNKEIEKTITTKYADTTIKVQPIITKLEALKAKASESFAGESFEKVADDMIKKANSLADKNGEILLSRAQEIKRNTDALISKVFSQTKEFGEAAGKTEGARVAVNELRNEIANAAPELKKLNKDASLWYSLRDSVIPVITKIQAQQPLSTFDLLLLTTGGPAGAGAVVGKKLLTSPSANLAAAHILQKLGIPTDALLRGMTQAGARGAVPQEPQSQ